MARDSTADPSPRTAPAAAGAGWLVALDTGGTFTDIVARDDAGRMHRAKVPSDGSILATLRGLDAPQQIRIEPAAGLVLPDGLLVGWSIDGTGGVEVLAHEGGIVTVSAAIALQPHAPIRFVRPHDPIDAPRLGLHIVTGTPITASLPPLELRLSTTRGTNALLEGKGAKVGVIVSDGLTGVVEIGDQTREDLFARVPRRTARIAHAVRAIPERSLADGSVEHAAPNDTVTRAAAGLAADGCDAIVVSLAHALTNAREETIASALAAGPVPVHSACAIAPHPRLLTRTETACIHARIAPILDAFIADATLRAPDARTFVFTSAGVLQRADRLLARDTLYSGPAGGAQAVLAVARRHGIPRAVGFDMGGTSSDVTRIADGAVALRGESRIGRMTVAAPSVAIDSVAAGGGSICRIRDGVLEVGPESAGAKPGPACYARGGPLTITDVNLLAGRMATGDGAMSLDRGRAEAQLAALRSEATHAGTPGDAVILQGFLDIADARMALAIEALCVRDGVDPKDHALIAFGGAGGQHACAIAGRLGCPRIVFPRFAGFMCAEGVFHSSPARFATVPVLRLLDACADALVPLRDQASDEAARALAADGFPAPSSIEVRAALRLSGQEASIEVPFGDAAEMRHHFETRFRELFGYEPPARGIELVSVDAVARGESDAHIPHDPASDGAVSRTKGRASEPGRATMLSEGARGEAMLYTRGSLTAGERIAGPAIITDAGETVVIDRSWCAIVTASGDLVAERTNTPPRRGSAAEQELFAARLESIALAMGNVLERTALSPNIRDRLDFSCAVLDADGTLVQNAPHLPVHLGALGACARAVMREIELGPGDIAVTNHPAFGGSHLPDVTTVAPVHLAGTRVAFVAVRAHHAEIGGTRPGSFPPDARSLAEEGVVLPPFHAVRAGRFDREGCRARFAGGPFPSRNPEENLADLQAQIAATRYGMARVAELAAEVAADGRGGFAARCEGELARAERALRRVLDATRIGDRSATCELDDGSAVRVRVASGRDGAGAVLHISFAGSSPTHPRNFNAPLAVTRAATLYALRLLIDEPIPMNEGLLRAVELDVPRGMLHPEFEADPRACPPVVAGNVETSQSVVAALLACFGFAAESQSTMNNTLFGNDRFTIYETLGGGAGAGPGGDGASGVHVHMSNTRLTDIDVLERRAPVVIRRFELRRGSGGAGAARGGDGIVRAYSFRAPVSLSFFGSRRMHAPCGAQGGASGATGVQHSVRGGSDALHSDAVLSLELDAGDAFTVETPGGGGFGSERSRSERIGT